MQTDTLVESDGEYDEIEEYEPEFSVFGSEQVMEKEESVLGKRNRDEQHSSSAHFDNAITLPGKWK